MQYMKWKSVVRRFCGSVSDTRFTAVVFVAHSQHFIGFYDISCGVCSVQCVQETQMGRMIWNFGVHFFHRVPLFEQCETNRVSTWNILYRASIISQWAKNKYIFAITLFILPARISIKYLSWIKKQKSKWVYKFSWIFLSFSWQLQSCGNKNQIQVLKENFIEFFFYFLSLKSKTNRY